MLSKNNHPKWWQLYLTFPLLIALFVMDSRFKISTRGHQAVQIVIILFVYGLIHFWLKANRSALSQMDQEQYGSQTFRVIRIPPAELPESHNGKRSILQLSDSEIRSLLSDTMDTSYIDAESVSTDESRKN